MITRYKYLQRIIPFIDKPLIKAVTGIRRCGKSTFLKQIITHLIENGIRQEQIISINKELLEFDSIRNYFDLHKFVSLKAKKTDQKYYLFIDEVQEIEEWEKAVNSFLAEDKYDIYISGSNARMLSSDLATLITGRYIEFKIYTLNFSEFKELYLTHQKNLDEDFVFTEYIKYGGFPGLHNLVWEESILRQYLESIYNTVVLKDVILKNKIKDVSMLNKIIVFIAANTGNITSAKSISDFVKSQGNKVSPDTVLNYLQYAMDALLIHKIKRYDIIGKTILETFEKYFLADTGLALNTLGNSPDTISGKLENIVLHELLSRGYKVNIGKSKEKEIDFIATLNSEKIYIQVCTTLTDEKVINREYGAFTGISDNYPKYVLSMDKSGFTTDSNGIKWKNLIDFLLDR
ncbi:MAG: ATP-binding protein [Bacteroidales bacterium]|nr:ATP-binding protein [Bacteroidales bacterium]